MIDLDWSIYELVNGRLSHGDAVELQRLIEHDDAARSKYWEWLVLDCILHEYLSQKLNVDASSEYTGGEI